MEFVHRVGRRDTLGRSKDIARFECILGPPRTILGSMIRKAFEDLHLVASAQNTNITAPFAAAMARGKGIALSFTYHSCMVKAPGVEYLSVGRKGLFLDLSLAYPAGEYRSKATMALVKMFHEIYQEASIRP